MPTPAALFAMVLFSLIGMGSFTYGKKQGLWKPIMLGVGLMIYPYFVSETWVLYVVGAVLTGLLFVLRE